MAAAAPAFAGSGSDSVQLVAGSTGVVPTSDFGVVFNDLRFSGASLRVWGTPGPGAALVLTISFVPFPGQPDAQGGLFVMEAIPGWSSTQVGTPVSSAVFTYAGPLSNGATVVIPDGTYVGTNYEGEYGTYHLTFSLAPLTPAVASFASGPVPSGGAGLRATERVSRAERAAARG
ncbi:hypothetical protein GCM10007231_11930 [Nocardioides daphniae]|uniref:Uncharacterized protein n=1 Tax=Nocardioides daphniae TaxID=402297 RepID=A0ABQ1Q675_9ACTN|nr:hypothetical protein GCM10007231_11930 [Nocardioides daphniae]